MSDNPANQEHNVADQHGGGGGSDDGFNGGAKRRRKLPSDLRLEMNSNPDLTDGPAIGGTISSRPAYTELKLEETFQTRIPPEEQKEHLHNIKEERRIGQEKKSKQAIALGILLRAFPFIKMLMKYDIKGYGPFDLISGISVGLFLIPQSMAYALLASVRPQYGFYSAFFSMVIYFFIGSSAHVNLTNQGAVSLLVGEAVRAGMDQVYPNGAGLCAPVAANATSSNSSSPVTGVYGTTPNTIAGTTPNIIAGTTPNTIAATTMMELNSSANANKPCINRDDANALIALTLTMIAGALQLAGGFLRLGFLTIYLSDPINKAFTCGAALHIVSGQVGNILGAPIPSFSGNGKFFLYFIEAFKQIVASRVNVPTILVFFGCFILLFAIKIVNEKFIKKIRVPIPIDIIVLILALLLSRYLFWQETLKIATVGEIRRGFEAPRVPIQEHFTSGSGIIVNGIVLGIIAYAMSISLAKTFALRNGYEVDPNQEMIAYGAANFIGSWLGTFVAASAIACSSLHESLKGKTQVYSLYAIVITFLAIMVFSSEFSAVPKCALSAIIIVNLKNMINQVDQLPTLWRTNRYDFFIFIVTLAAILGLDLPIGLLIGVGFSLVTIIYRSQAPKAYLLGRLPQTDIYRNIKKHKKAEQIPGVKIFKYEGSVYSASAENYRSRLFRQVGMNPKKILDQAKLKAKKEGRAAGEIDLRTDLIRSEGIKQILDVVREEGSHPTADARIVAQVTMPVQKSAQTSLDQLAYEPEEVASTVNVFCIILDLSACAFTDSVGIRLLSQIVGEFNKIGVEIYLSGVTWQVRSQLRRANFYAKRSEDGLFVTVHDAVLHALSSLYLELLEDEKHRKQAEEEPSAEDVSGSSGIVEPAAHKKRAKPSAGELARDRRRRIRKESWLGQSGVNGRQITASSLPADSSVLRQSIFEATEGVENVNGQVKFELPPNAHSSPQIVPTGPGIVGRDNPGFDGETKF